MRLSATLLVSTLATEIPKYGSINDIMFTREQIKSLEEQGLNTETFLVDTNISKSTRRKWAEERSKKNIDPKSLKAVTTYTRWTNQPEYTGTNLRVPYRIESSFSSSDQIRVRRINIFYHFSKIRISVMNRISGSDSRYDGQNGSENGWMY